MLELLSKELPSVLMLLHISLSSHARMILEKGAGCQQAKSPCMCLENYNFTYLITDSPLHYFTEYFLQDFGFPQHRC
jgi:hypothetical protein